MQALYYIDIRGNGSDDKVALFFQLHPPPEKQKAFLLELINGVIRYRSALDTIIDGFSSHWKISRMSCVDRNVLRIAAFEILTRDDIPAKVSINEAIDIGKKYGTENSGAFINGILDSIHQQWRQGLITFDPLVDSDADNDGKEGVNGSAKETDAHDRYRGETIEPLVQEKRSIRLTDRLRKRSASQNMKIHKRGGDDDS